MVKEMRWLYKEQSVRESPIQQEQAILDEKLGDPNIKQIFWVSGSRNKRQIRQTGKDQKQTFWVIKQNS